MDIPGCHSPAGSFQCLKEYVFSFISFFYLSLFFGALLGLQKNSGEYKSPPIYPASPDAQLPWF